MKINKHTVFPSKEGQIHQLSMMGYIRLLVTDKADLSVVAFQAVQSAAGSDDELCRGRQLSAEEEQKLPRNEDNSDISPDSHILHTESASIYSSFWPYRSSLCL